MKVIAEKDLIGMGGTCRECGSDVARYTCNQWLTEQRPEGYDWDWWASCTNEDCTNHYGDGYFQMPLKWIKYGWQES